MTNSGIGAPVTRLEDDRLLRGGGRYTENLHFENELYAVFVRSPHAHADIKGIDTAAALEMPGVRVVFTGADTAELGPIRSISPVTGSDGSAMIEPPRLALVRDRVRHVGECVALVVAETQAQAMDAAEAVFVDYAERPAVIGARRALAASEAVWDEAPGNQSFDWREGDSEATAAAFAAADHVVRQHFEGNRLHYGAIEARSAIALPEDSGMTLHCPSQGARMLQVIFADHAFQRQRDWLRVVTGDVGGGFGPKGFAYPEPVAVIFAAEKLDCPVRWISSRDESFVSDAQSRSLDAEIELALDKDGRFLALRFDGIFDLGAYVSTFGSGIAVSGPGRALPGWYDIPAIHVKVRAAFTNTVTMDAFRGSGGVDPMTMLECLVDAAAARLGRDPIDLRRQNLIRPEAMPHTTVLGKYYESGDLPALLDAALERSDRAGFEARRRLSESQGLKRGFGLGACVHGTGGVADERGAVTVHPEGYITATAGGQDTGQGHGTIYAQIAAEAFGVPYSDVRLSEGDTAEIAWGGGTGGSSSTIISGVNVSLAAKLAADKGRLLAGHVLEAATEDIELVEGRFQIRGTDRGIGLYELAAEAAAQNDLPEATNGVIEGTSLLKESVATFPQGCITCEVEIDPQTGGVRVDRVASVADVGVVVNPLLLEGQMHGAIVQGIGHALWENCWYDPETGQLIAGSWMDYVLPRAEDVPNIDHATMASPATQNPLGVKGAGELGCLGAPAAVINAVCDALGCVEDEQITLPLNAERIWRLANRE